ncbi:MAG: type II toxin-antitoxin system HicB family antitoxin [Nanoarchaeota archaeon]
MKHKNKLVQTNRRILDKQFVALCPEVDVVSQGYTIEEALANLKEAVELYVEEMGMPKEFTGHEAIVTRFAVEENAKIA